MVEHVTCGLFADKHANQNTAGSAATQQAQTCACQRHDVSYVTIFSGSDFSTFTQTKIASHDSLIGF